MTDGIGEVDVPNVYIFFRQACLGQSIFSGLPHTLLCLIDVSQYGTRGKKGRTFSQLVNRRVDDFWSQLRGRDHQSRSTTGRTLHSRLWSGSDTRADDKTLSMEGTS